MKNKPKSPRILLIDIETTPNHILTWGIYEQNALAVTKEWQLLCFAYKYLGEANSMKCFGTDTESERTLVKRAWKLIDSADILMGHNLDRFDLKKLNAKFAEFGLAPPSPVRTIDTLKIARRKFAFNSNKLDDLGKILGVGRKNKTGGFSLWEGCMAGDKSSWKKMKEYNKQDVTLLEKVYMKLRMWDATHPNIAVMRDEPEGCPVCGSNKTQKRGTIVTAKTKKTRHHCQDCSHWFSGKKVKQEK